MLFVHGSDSACLASRRVKINQESTEGDIHKADLHLVPIKSDNENMPDILKGKGTALQRGDAKISTECTLHLTQASVNTSNKRNV